MEIKASTLFGAYIITPDIFIDNRGFFIELWQSEKYEKLGLLQDFVQDNLSYSTKGTLRGLHFQNPTPQGKLVTVLQGEVFDVMVDLRTNSPTFGKWEGVILSEENKKQIYVPEGFAHGFVVTSETALFYYKCTEFYQPKNEKTLLWNDSDVGIEWPVKAPTVSIKDERGLRLKEFGAENLF